MKTEWLFVSDFSTFRVHPITKGLYPKEKLDGRTREAKRLKRAVQEFEHHINGIASVAWSLGLDQPRDLFPE